ncbi:MAG: hypothetical protein ACKODH_12675 [Limisphaerales bacterium]
MKRKSQFLALAISLACANAFAGVTTAALREAAEAIMRKFGRGAAGETAEQVAEALGKTIAKHGEESLPLIRSAGHRGVTALEEAGAKAPEVIKLFAKRGDEALWIISEKGKLAIFLKHGDSAAEALLKHPSIADSLINQFGKPGATALNAVSQKSAQHLAMLAEEGALTKLGRQEELLQLVGRRGDAAMEFVWKHKGPLAVTAVLTTFLASPDKYIDGTKKLITDPIFAQINWTVIVCIALVILLAPFTYRWLARARLEKAEKLG